MEDANQVEAASEAHLRSTKKAYDSTTEQKKYVLDILKNTLGTASQEVNRSDAIKQIEMLQNATNDLGYKQNLSELANKLRDAHPSDLSKLHKLDQLVEKTMNASQDSSQNLNSYVPNSLPITADVKNPFAAKVPEVSSSKKSHNEDKKESKGKNPSNNKNAKNGFFSWFGSLFS
ncbi:hypothetical protein HOG98_07120 [bacterium]|jgi:hypothetical protein|nr:hypothetical protein [bacterium]